MAEGAIVSQESDDEFERAAAFPRTLRRGFASGVRKLDAEPGVTEAAAMRDHPRKRRFTVVRIKPEAAVGNAPAALDAGRLYHYQRGPRIAQHAEVVQVPVGRNAIIGAVLAHGRNDDPAAKVESSEPDWGKKGTGHGVLDLEKRCMWQ